MQSQTNSRKRPAPGADPIAPQSGNQQQQQQFQPLSDNPVDFSSFDFTSPLAADSIFQDNSTFDANNFSLGGSPPQPHTFGGALAPAASTELVRRSGNQQIAPANAPPEQWNGLGIGANRVDEVADEEDLKARIARAKKDSHGKRKQIPPFVQKLWSFLESNNTDLIRWSDDGKSFIVLDEDEFARTMIPELFKHNNYASFVRQLNMYGFHKTVNITDGSLRQSEKARKGVKPPSMYSHEYFQRNQPELLWLIQKPAGKSSSKRKSGSNPKGQYDSDDERELSPVPEGRSHELSAPGGSQDLTHLPRNELVAVRQELQKLQRQQTFISSMINQLKEQNDQFYRQATAFQALHDRHENSINAILSFLATFYNRSMEGHGAQNLVNMFATAAQGPQQHGSVVEEFNDPADANGDRQLQRYQRRPPLLLTGPPASKQHLQPGSAATQPNSARPSASPDIGGGQRAGSSSVPPDSRRSQPPRTTASPVIKNDAGTPDLNQIPESNDHMLNLIQNATQASTPPSGTPAFDFTSLLGDAGAGPLTPQQRDNVVRSFANMQGGEGAGDAATSALANPATPDVNNFTSQLKQSNDALERLTSMQKRQDARVQELNRRLQPLSPTGTIPGLDVSNVDPFDSLGAPGDYDPNAFIDFDGDLWDGAGGGGGGADGGADFNFNFDPGAGAAASGSADWPQDTDDLFGAGADGSSKSAPPRPSDEGRIESVSSSATTPHATVEEEEPGTPSKRPRRA